MHNFTVAPRPLPKNNSPVLTGKLYFWNILLICGYRKLLRQKQHLWHKGINHYNMKIILSILAMLLLEGRPLSAQPAMTDTQKAIVASVEKHRGELIAISNKIWAHAETAFEETQSAKLLADYAEQQGFRIEFFGQAAHASVDPWNGRSAADALQHYTSGVNFYREHVKPTFRMHYHIQDGGQVVNVLPDYARLWMRVRNTQRKEMMPVYEQLKCMAEGAAIMANVDYKVSLISGIYEILLENPKLVEEVKAEFKQRKGDEVYVPLIPDGPPPIPVGLSRNE